MLGWELEPYGPREETGGYGLFRYRGKVVAAVDPLGEGQPPAWASFVRVTSADETAGTVKEAGGSVVLGPADGGDACRFAVCRDPQGAVFGLWEPKQHQGAELVNEVGAWTWNNLMTRDLDQAKDFYGEVLGWDATHPEQAPDFIWSWQVEGQRWPEGLGNLMEMGSDMPADAPPHWQVYFAVESADGAVEKTTQSGGNLLFGPLDVPLGRMAVLTDPQGAAFAVIEPEYPEPR